MSMGGEIRFEWGDGEHIFKLRLGELRELEDRRDCGIMTIYKRLNSDNWRIDDVREIIRLGLIGGGMEPTKVLRLVKRYVDDVPVMANALLAQSILAAAMVGPPLEDEAKSDDEGKSEGEPEKTGFPSSVSTETVQ